MLRTMTAVGRKKLYGMFSVHFNSKIVSSSLHRVTGAACWGSKLGTELFLCCFWPKSLQGSNYKGLGDSSYKLQ